MLENYVHAGLMYQRTVASIHVNGLKYGIIQDYNINGPGYNEQKNQRREVDDMQHIFKHREKKTTKTCR